MQKGIIKVFHLEDYKIVRDGIKYLLSQDDEIRMVGDAGSADELYDALSIHQPDILLLDLYLDGIQNNTGQNGFEVCAFLKKNHPQIKVIAHSVYDDAEKVAKVIKAGAKGYVSKKAGFEELITAIKSVFQDNIYICKETSKRLKNLKDFLEGNVATLKNEDEKFSPREKDVLRLLAKGYSTKQIAESLFITVKTVETHRKNLIDKAGVKNTAELVAYGASLGMIK